MKRQLMYILIICYSCLIGCAADDASNNESEYIEEVQPTIGYIYVDVKLGSDIYGDGKSLNPFRTITRAIEHRLINYYDSLTIYVKTGIYDSSIGEEFPLYLPIHVELKCGENTQIIGSGEFISDTNETSQSLLVCIACSGDNVVKGFKISAENGIAIWCNDYSSNRSYIVSNYISNSDYGIVTSGNSKPLIFNNNILQNIKIGIETLDESFPEIRNNNITENAVGISIQNYSKPDIGTAIDPGQNIIKNNRNCNINNQVKNETVLFAIGNEWNNDISSINISETCINGQNIVSFNYTTVIYQSIPGKNPIFQVNESIELIAPGQGAMISVDEPEFHWVTSNKRFVLACVSTNILEIYDNRIKNTKDIVWIWHTGIGSGREGSIQYSYGKNVTNGEINEKQEPIPLERGKIYYWSVWAWDEKGQVISASSDEYYFTISN